MVASTHWLASAAGMAVLEQGGQRVRRRRRDRLHAAGRRAAPERARRRPAGAPLAGGPRAAARPLRAGFGAAEGDDRALPRRARTRRSSPVPGRSPRSCRAPSAAGSRCCASTGRCRSATCSASRSATRRTATPPSRRSATRSARSSSSSATTGRRASTSISRVPATGALHRNPTLAATYRRLLEQAEAVSPDRDTQLEAAHDCWYRGFVAEEIVRFQEHEWLDSSGERHSGLLAEEDLRDWGPTWEEPLSVDLPRLRGLQGRPVEPGAGLPPAAPPARGLRPRRHGTGERRLGAHRHRVREARVRRPRSVVRRPGVHRRAARRAALAGVRRGAAAAARRRVLAGAPSGLARRPRAAPAPASRRARRSRRASASRRGATPSISTSSTATETWSRPRRAAAGSGGPRDPVARLLPRYAGPDVLARGGTAELARARQASADDALADARGPRRRLAPRPRHARRRPAGPVDAARLPRPCPPRARPPGRDRRSEPPHRGVSVELLPARDPSRGTSPSRNAPAARRSTACVFAGTTSRSPDPGALGRVTAVGRESGGILKAGADPRVRQGYAAGR